MAEIQSQVEEMLFKMNALAGTANLPKKSPIDTSDSDCTYNADSENKEDYQVEFIAFSLSITVIYIYLT